MQRNREINLRNILCAILVNINKRLEGKNKKQCAFELHNNQFHPLFKKLAGKYGILDCFVFFDSGPDPYSRDLAEALIDLQVCRFINRYDSQNPNRFKITKMAEEFYKKEMRLTLEELDQVRQIGKELKEKIPHILI